MGYIKSKSNYVIKTKHQNTNDGTIYERDAVTIGGIDQFAPNQVPIYKSGNFILTINNESNPSKKISNDKWEENDNGVVWTLNDVKNIDEDTDEINANIVLKKDYYSLKDFAYFGSCSELIRVSINDILTRFPGEMYGSTTISKGEESGLVVYYTDTTAGLSVDKTEIKPLGGGNLFVLENPSSINMHTEFLTSNQITDKLKYFCNDGYKNYEIYDKDNKITEITSWSYRDTEDCKTRKVGEITLNGVYKIYLYKGDGDILYYLYSGKTLNGIHIRPKTIFYNQFIESLDIFQKVIFNPNSEPKYKSVFEIISENDFGYLTTLKTFIMPLGNGGYNIGSSSIPFEIYLKELSDIADFYDETFCDNLYRSMTHESIKNFDWTYNRNSTDNETDEYNIGGDKIAKLIRLYGRKFDDIKTYIENIGNSNTITYNDVNNVPDYFLTDILEMDGWDIKNIYSLLLNEYIIKDKNVKLYRDKTENEDGFLDTFNKAGYGTINELTNKVGTDKNALILNRLFKQNLDLLVKPYSTDNMKNFKKGYFNTCCNGGKIEYVDGMSDIYVDECGAKPILRNLIKSYSNEKEYTADDINNAFMKRLKLNSRQIFRHKGTIEGIEMILSMFGLKSKTWCDKWAYDKKLIQDYNGITSDYKIIEYTSFTNYIKDIYRNDKKDYSTDWFNSTKLIQYNTVDFMNGAYVPYQGLPIAFREEALTNQKNQPRRLYPFFDKNEYYDGNPYYQMNGGWLKKTPIQFDKENNIIGMDENLFTETLRTVKSVNKVESLTTIPTQILSDGDIYYVNDIDSELAIVDGYPYEIKSEEYDNKVYQYFSVYTNNGSLIIGDVYFYDFINVSTPYTTNKEVKIIFNDLSNNNEVKIYIVDEQIKAYSNDVTINNFQIFKNGNYFGETEKDNRFTHYFRLNNIDYKSEISPYGWEQLANDDKDYYRLNAIVDYFKGNNPHNGNFNYDNGYDYLTYFKQIFKYAYNNELFDKRCYGDTYYEKMVEISKIGFNGLINDNDDCDLDYNSYMNPDTKIHYFGKIYTNKKIEGNNLFAYQSETTSVTDDKIVDYFYTIEDDNNLDKSTYNLKNVCKIHDTNNKNITNNFYGNTQSDGITHQILNNKRIDIIFNIDGGDLSKTSLERIKYIDSVILPYMTQLLPPTAICTIKYEKYNG